ncbi:MAG: hypothetical protein AAB439_02270 [Patescibacteria group bacterium]
MDLSFVEPKTVFLILHLVGLALGVGGALISDAMFFKAIKDKRIIKTEMEFLRLGSWSVGLGLMLLVFSGLGMFMLDHERYLASSKFLAKMSVVAILIVNGVVLHQLQIPYLMKITEKHSSTLAAFSKTRTWFIVGGVVSIVSWLSALTLGAFRSIPWSYGNIMMVYLAVLALGLVVAYVLRDVLFPPQK